MGVNFSVPLAVMALFELSDADFTELERAGGIKLSAELRVRLQATGKFWTVQLAIVRSPGPKQVRKSLKANHEAAEAGARGARSQSA
jgi:hypothetical protein